MDPSYCGFNDSSSVDEFWTAGDNVMGDNVKNSNSMATTGGETGGTLKTGRRRYGREEIFAVLQNSSRRSSPIRFKETCPDVLFTTRPQPVSVSERSDFESGGSSTISHDQIGQTFQRFLPATPLYVLASGNSPQSAPQPPRCSGIGRGRPVNPTPPIPVYSGIGRGRRLAAWGIGESTSVAETLSMVGLGSSSAIPIEKPNSPASAVAEANVEFENELDFERKRHPSSSSLGSASFIPIQQRWYYIDPLGTMQGPFISKDMADWFAAGFFPMQMQLRREEEETFLSLGDLIKKCGRVPFYASLLSEKLEPSPTPLLSPSSEQYIDADQLSPSANSPTQLPIAITEASRNYMSVRSESSQKLVEDDYGLEQRPSSGAKSGRSSGSELEQRPVVSSRAKSGRNGGFESDVAPVVQASKGPENVNNERKQQVNAELLAKLKLLDQKKREDRERKRLEEERQRQFAEAAAKEAEERRLHAIREKDEQIKRFREQIQEEQRRWKEHEEARIAEEEEIRKQQRLLEEQQRRLAEKVKRDQEERSRMARVMAEEQRLRQCKEEDAWNQPQAAAPIKPAPWAAQGQHQQWSQQRSRTVSNTQSLKEIQMEEERQAIAERRQELEFAKQLKRHNGTEQPSGGAWGQRKHTGPKLSYDDLLPPADLSPGRPAAQINQKNDVKSPVDPFTKWCVKQVKALNNEIDAMAFLELLNESESPSDAETYIFSYFGDCGPARDFLENYLQRRNMVSKVVPAAQDPSKKPAKGPKVVLDTAALGFKYRDNPDRVGAKDFG